MKKFKKYLFWSLFVILTVTFFTRNNYRSAKEIIPDLLAQPKQEKIYAQENVIFEKDSYRYTLTPLYDYEINGLVVGKMNYRRFSIYKYSNIFPYDLCLIWGSNLKNGYHTNRAVSYRQDCRWCWVDWRGPIRFNVSELSNNHCLVNNHTIERILNKLVKGDQIKLKGKLVNVTAKYIGKKKTQDPQQLTWKSSINRTDTGAGACEVIYVESIEILKKANVLSFILFHISLYGLLLFIVINTVLFFVVK